MASQVSYHSRLLVRTTYSRRSFRHSILLRYVLLRRRYLLYPRLLPGRSR
jgi:hypothetical protein